MAKVNVAGYVAANERRWKAMRVDPAKVPMIDRVARRLVAPENKSRFRDMERATGVPWPIVAVIKEREAGADPQWQRSIAQGDPWGRVSVHVPKGRGPFRSWREAALDALIRCAPYAARWKDWTYGGAITLLVMYNGLGYDRRGLPSPYGWASSDQYRRGKYVADGVFDPNVVDQQLGCAPLLKRMGEIDSDATLKERGTAAEKGGAVAGGAGGAAEAGRQTAETHAANGWPLSRILIVVGIGIAASVAIYFVVKWARQYRPVVVEHDENLIKHARVPGADEKKD